LIRDSEPLTFDQQGNPASYTRIEGLRMQTVYYSVMSKPIACAILLFTAACLAAQDTSLNKNTSRSDTAMHPTATDSHEGITIGLEPWTQESQYKRRFPKKTPLSKGVVGINVSFRNDTDQGMKVNLQSIRLIVQLDEDNRQELQSMSADDVADTVMLKNNGKDPTAKRSPIPFPIPTKLPSAARDSKWTEFRDQCQNAGVPSNIVAAHGSVEGLIYFDIRGEMDLLQTAHVYFPNIVSMRDNQPVSYFDIPLGRNSSE